MRLPNTEGILQLVSPRRNLEIYSYHILHISVTLYNSINKTLLFYLRSIVFVIKTMTWVKVWIASTDFLVNFVQGEWFDPFKPEWSFNYCCNWFLVIGSWKMNELDRNLAELALLNKSDLPPNPHLTLRKKVGPAVPPKPKKQQPLVRLFLLVFRFIDLRWLSSVGSSIVPFKANRRA